MAEAIRLQDIPLASMDTSVLKLIKEKVPIVANSSEFNIFLSNRLLFYKIHKKDITFFFLYQLLDNRDNLGMCTFFLVLKLHRCTYLICKQ